MMRSDEKVRKIVREELDKVVGELLVRFYFGDAFGAAEANEQEIEISPEDISNIKEQLGLEKTTRERKSERVKYSKVLWKMQVGDVVQQELPWRDGINADAWERRWKNAGRRIAKHTLPARKYSVESTDNGAVTIVRTK